jgi:hypothetical protein
LRRIYKRGLFWYFLLTMKLQLWLVAMAFSCLAVLMLTGCPAPQSQTPSRDGSNESTAPGEISNVQNPGVQDTPGPETEDREVVVRETALGFMGKLGYDTSTLEITSMELQPAADMVLWNVQIGNDLGKVADLNVNENTLRMTLLGLIFIREGILAPGDAGSDDDPAGRIADAIGLIDEGYRLVKANGTQNEYRKYADWEDYQIAMSYVVISVPPDEASAVLLDWREGELHPPVVINIDREEAIAKAISYLGDSLSGTEPSSVDLIQYGTWAAGGTDFPVYWEVAFGQQIVNVNTANGEIMGARAF